MPRLPELNTYKIKHPLIIRTRSLTKTFGNVHALEDCSLSIARGTTFGLLGPNGAGKSTLIRLLMGFLHPTSGTASIDSLDCHRSRVAVHQRVSYIPGDARLFRMMRGRNVLRLLCDMRGDSDFERAAGVAKRLELDLSRLVVFMSTGMRQKLALSLCLSCSSPVLILDEPTANLDPTIRGEVLNLIREAKEAGRTVILSSHVLSEIEEICDEVGILRAGRLVHMQAMADVLKQHRIVARLEGSMPDVPPELADELTIRRQNDRVQIVARSELSTVLNWLAGARLQDVHIQPLGLRAVYDRFHRTDLVYLDDETVQKEARA